MTTISTGGIIPAGGTTADNDLYIGKNHELSVDETTHGIRVHDGLTQGGFAVVDAFSDQTIGGNKTFSGNVGIGTASPNTQLHLDDISNVGPQITLSAPNGGTPGIIFRPYQTSSLWSNPAQASITASDNNYSANIHFFTKIPGAVGNALSERITIQNNGNVGIGITNPTHLLTLNGGAYCDGSGSWVTGSDRAYKRDIKPLTKYGLKEILKLNPVTYIHKLDKDNKVQLGLIAQDVKPVLPEMVEGKDGSYGLAYDRLPVVEINAIKELKSEIDALKAEIAALKAKIK